MKRLLFRAAALALMVCCLSACKPEALPPGVVALVNGRPITLRMIEARHDADGAFATVSQSPSVDLLREQYSGILAELIVQELVAQELERLDMAITEDEVQAGIRGVKDDYSEESFDEALFHDNIDEHAWKELMRYTLVMLRFSERVLRPQITFDDNEIRKYYLERPAEFLIPAHHAFRVLTSSSREDVETARTRILENKSLLDLPTVHVQHVDLRPSMTPEFWQKDLAGLKEGQASRVREVNGMYQCVVLEKRNPARQMEPVEVYPRIEKALLEWKMKTLFAEWLDAATAEADIRISPLLRQFTTPDVKPVSDVPLDSEPILGDEAEDEEPSGSTEPRSEAAAPEAQSPAS